MKGRDVIVSMLYTNKKLAMQDVAYFSSGDATDIWMCTYAPNPACPGHLQIECNECVWEK